MNCVEFKNWIRDVNAHDPADRQEAKSHMAVCPKCEKLYTLDRAIEQRFSETLAEIDPPGDLYTKIKQDLPVEPIRRKKPAMRWRMVAPALAAAVVVFLVFIIYPGGPIHDIDHIGSLALANHLDDRQSMAFNAGEINDIAAWFVKRIGFAAAPPKLLDQGFVFQGARQCKLGSNDAAYLYYKNNGKKCSLFIINPDDLKFKLKRNKNYFIDIKNHDVRVWTEDGLVYAMVN
jgi:anti-sigma factor RsiW